jgi:hypothetical protein
VFKDDEHTPSRRINAPISPGLVQRSAAAKMRRLSALEKCRRRAWHLKLSEIFTAPPKRGSIATQVSILFIKINVLGNTFPAGTTPAFAHIKTYVS